MTRREFKALRRKTERKAYEKLFLMFFTTAAALCLMLMLTGCAGMSGDLQPDGLHTHTRTCYKNKGCAVSDCVIHYEAEGRNVSSQ